MTTGTTPIKTAALIVAAGRGRRAGGGVPKQWRPLAGKRVLDHAINAFTGHPGIDEVAVVLHPDDIQEHADVLRARGLLVGTGGAERSDSVAAGLVLLTGNDKVLIHDAARPCVSASVIDGVLDALKYHTGAAPGLAVSDALWLGEDGIVQDGRDRTGLFAAQTPQGFDLAAIRDSHAAYDGPPAADDVAIARAAGITVAITPGSADNIKVTTPEDFARAARILERHLDIRTGNGFDVHAFGPGDGVTLCGVHVAHDKGLIGHSDADVGLHTVTDAIYGALAQGDIGQHFPPSDPQWKGAASDIFLRHAANLARDMGFRLTHVDCTLICETPKIGPHTDAMRAAMAEMLGIEESRVSVKATTTERLGFAGRGEGIACMATATLVKT